MRTFLLLVSLCGYFRTLAQTDTIFRIPLAELTATERIAQDRQLLREAFLSEDDPTANALLDTLHLVLEDSFLAATYAEERWLIWYWTGRYDRIFAEVTRYDQRYRFLQSQKVPPPADSLLDLLDEVSQAHNEQLYQAIAAADLNTEEKSFASLHLEYLLSPRPTLRQMTDQDERVLAFLEKFPRSRFRAYAREFLYSGTKMQNRGNDLDAMLTVARPDRQLGVNFRNSFGFSLAYGVWRERWQFGGRASLGFMQADRNFSLERTDVAADSTIFSACLTPEAGYILWNGPKMRLMPCLGAGLAFMSVPARADPDLELSYRYLNVCAQLGALIDYRFGKIQRDDEWFTGGSSQLALRIGLGYQWLGFGGNDPQLRGGQFFVGVGLGFQARRPYEITD